MGGTKPDGNRWKMPIRDSVIPSAWESGIMSAGKKLVRVDCAMWDLDQVRIHGSDVMRTV